MTKPLLRPTNVPRYSSTPSAGTLTGSKASSSNTVAALEPNLTGMLMTPVSMSTGERQRSSGPPTAWAVPKLVPITGEVAKSSR